MSAMTAIEPISGASTKSVSPTSRLQLEITSLESPSSASSADGAAFRSALERHLNTSGSAVSGGVADNKMSLGQKISARATNLATEINKDQQYVSKMLEQATRTGDSMQLMKAMMALNDYQIRVQTISKTVSKATQAVEQLTKLQ